MTIAKSLASAVVRRVCQHCDRWIWRDTGHRYAHRECAHRHRLALWVRGRDEFGYNVPFQPCVDCGEALR